MLVLVASCARAPTVEQRPAAPAELPAPLTHYMGREIATTMHWSGADWLLREKREDEEHATRMLAALGVRPGDVVCDFGCGAGFHTLPLAELTGPSGRVYAVDVQPEMLELLEERLAGAGIDNVVPIQGDLADPKLPPGECDLILLVDVYHELGYPVQVLAGLRRALKPGGRVALVEFRAEDPSVPIKPLHKLSKAQALRELEANGYQLESDHDGLPWQHLMFFEPAGP
jgi:ubiquinone/menaquinone biosynthesis C-methylase UbiE